MENLGSPFSGRKFNKLVAKRKRIFFIGIPLFICSFGIIFYMYTKGIELNSVLTIIILLLCITPFVLIWDYSSAVTRTAYDMVAENSGWQMYHKNSKFRGINSAYQDFIKKFGVLSSSGHVEFKNKLEGEIKNRKFVLQDISWVVPKRTRTGKRDESIAKYSLLTIDNTFQINCNILIKKNTVLKWGISKLKRVKIEDKEFEKYYDVYTDTPEVALTVLNAEFIRILLYNKKVYNNLVEVIITHENIFFHQKSMENESRLNLNFFIQPMELCRKKMGYIIAKLNILSLTDWLSNK